MLPLRRQAATALRALCPQEITQHLEVSLGRAAAREMLHDVAASVTAQSLT